MLKTGKENRAWTFAWGAQLRQLRKGWDGRAAILLPSCDLSGRWEQAQLAKEKAAPFRLHWFFWMGHRAALFGCSVCTAGWSRPVHALFELWLCGCVQKYSPSPLHHPHVPAHTCPWAPLWLVGCLRAQSSLKSKDEKTCLVCRRVY